MNNNMKNFLIIYLSIAFLITVGLGFYSEASHLKDVKDLKLRYDKIIEDVKNESIYDERCVVYDKRNLPYIENSNVNGVYFPSDDYYVVWVKNRELDDIEETDRHEYCHWLVDVQGEHFCEGYCEND